VSSLIRVWKACIATASTEKLVKLPAKFPYTIYTGMLVFAHIATLEPPHPHRFLSANPTTQIN
jgi:hypothetical protein